MDIMDEMKKGDGMDSMDSASIESQKLSEEHVIDMLLAKWRVYKAIKRVRAFDALDSERNYQEDINPGEIPIPEELVLLRVYLRKAEEAFAATFGDPSERPTMDVIRKIGGICLRCMENHGSVKRKWSKDNDEKCPC